MPLRLRKSLTFKLFDGGGYLVGAHSQTVGQTPDPGHIAR